MLAHRTWRILVSVAVLTAFAGGLTVAAHELRRPVYLAAPSAPTPTRLGINDVCLSLDSAGRTSSRRRPWVDPHPTGAVVLWTPGLSTRPCQTTMSVLNAADAEVLATAVRHAPRLFDGGTTNCPSDDNRAATVFFAYLDETQAQVIRFATTGCSHLTAPDRAARGIGEAASAVLTRRAPTYWSRS